FWSSWCPHSAPARTRLSSPRLCPRAGRPELGSHRGVNPPFFRVKWKRKSMGGAAAPGYQGAGGEVRRDEPKLWEFAGVFKTNGYTYGNDEGECDNGFGGGDFGGGLLPPRARPGRYRWERWQSLCGDQRPE